MIFPTMQEVSRYREMTTAFGGYNHRLSCREGQFFDMKNMTSQYYPVLSPRNKRGDARKMNNPQGMMVVNGEFLWIEGGILFSNVKGALTSDSKCVMSEGYKTMVKMGAYIVIMPDKVYYNTETGEMGRMEASFYVAKDNETPPYGVSFTLCEADGTAITWHDEEYYKTNEPKNGDYMMTTVNGKSSLKVYSSTTSIWMTVATTYVQISATGIGKDFEKGDGVKITIDNAAAEWENASNIFVNDEGDGMLSTNTYIVDKTDDCITIIGLLDENKSFWAVKLTVERKVPDMAFITECNNRLWGCSEDGHEIYCCKLGDVKNWNCFMGISTDSWAVTIGSDGKFTGAITYLGYPIFFKEDGLIKISVSGTGGHQTKETKCRGVQKGCGRSLAILNETLFYKSTDCICAYTGSLPTSISDELGEVRYYDAVAGTMGDRYYVSMRDKSNVYHMFVYDQKTGVWSKEDNTKVLQFYRHEDDLLYIKEEGADNRGKKNIVPKVQLLSGYAHISAEFLCKTDDVIRVISYERSSSVQNQYLLYYVTRTSGNGFTQKDSKDIKGDLLYVCEPDKSSPIGDYYKEKKVEVCMSFRESYFLEQFCNEDGTLRDDAGFFEVCVNDKKYAIGGSKFNKQDEKAYSLCSMNGINFEPREYQRSVVYDQPSSASYFINTSGNVVKGAVVFDGYSVKEGDEVRVAIKNKETRGRLICWKMVTTSSSKMKSYLTDKIFNGVTKVMVPEGTEGMELSIENSDEIIRKYGNQLYALEPCDIWINDTLHIAQGMFHEQEVDYTVVKEGDYEWYAESGNIGYSSPDNKYVSRINLRMSLEFGANVDFYIQYDSSGKWEHKFNMAGTGTRTFTIPVIPKRCDHFKYKLVGKGNCKIFSITKTIEEGSDV